MKFNRLWQYIAMNTDKSVSKVFIECGISSQTLHTMRNPGKLIAGRIKGGVVNLKVIDRLCKYLKCQPCDIMETE